nr:ribonuclease H-like domain-containing protein [Tanacetum cinerariifolium]
MAFISSSKNSSNEDGNTACVTTASTAFPTGSVNVATISQDTASAYIASQSNGSQIKFEDINQIDEDDIKEMDIKWSMALLSMRADKFWKRTGNKINIQGSDVAGFDKSKVECFNYHKMGHFARECRAPRSQETGRKERYRQGSKAKEKTSKALMAIDGVGWDWSYMANEGEDHTLVVDGEAPTEFALMANTESKSYKEALTESCWIEAMQEELNEFERLEVWEMVPHPDHVMIVTLKWIYKVKSDKVGGVLKNKAGSEGISSGRRN